MVWWRHRSNGTVSWSMVSLVVTLAAALALGLSLWLPARSEDGIGITELAPGLLTVVPAARGEVTLGAGLTVAMSVSGLRVALDGEPLLDSATRASLLSVLTGGVADQRERVTASLSNLRIDALTFGNGHAVWTGAAYGSAGLTGRQAAVRVDATRDGPGVRVVIEVPGADGLVVHLDPRPATVGVLPALPQRSLRERGWWAAGDATTLYRNVLAGAIGLAAPGAARAVDMRPDGLLDVHVWADRAVLTIVPLPGSAVADS